MTDEPHFKNAEERDIARGGKATAVWIMSIALVVIAGGLLLAYQLRQVVSPPERPGTTSATTTAGEQVPPSPSN